MEELKCPADILYEKEWRSSYGNRCNAIFLSDVMNDHESMRKLFHSNGDTHSMSPLVGIFYDYYKDEEDYANYMYQYICLKRQAQNENILLNFHLG